ncbi:hypothetical protein LINPERHAP1_LOCUS24768, partial [Linum perenne]
MIYKSAKTRYVLESTTISRRAATSAAKDITPKKRTLLQCQSFCKEFSLFLLATMYIWFANMKVSGSVLIAPVRLMKSPRNGSIADTSVLAVRYSYTGLAN